MPPAEMMTLHLPSFSIQPSPHFPNHCFPPNVAQLRSGFRISFHPPLSCNAPLSKPRLRFHLLKAAASEPVSPADVGFKAAASDPVSPVDGGFEAAARDSVSPADGEFEAAAASDPISLTGGGFEAASSNSVSSADGGSTDSPGEIVKSDNLNDTPDSKRSIIPKFQEAVSHLTPFVYSMRTRVGGNYVVWLCTATALLFIAVRVIIGVTRKPKHSRPGTVADLVRRGQLRSDRRGIPRSPEYDDPFNNPFVKAGKSNSTVEVCGKVYKLAPVTLTKEEQATHQRRRSRAYQWKRPTMFLKEGDSVPDDVDPDSVRWIPANHPFATTTSDIDENLAENNVHQKHGVPYRIQAEHEALQQKLEALQQGQKPNKFFADNGNAKEYDRSSKLHPKSSGAVEQKSSNSLNSISSSDEPQKP
ncbi:Protein MULTIPLE CHLOROPLAST DIVISION SITE 1 [Linum perenne]